MQQILIVAHPAHELRVFHWLETVRPTVFVLTDGAGSNGRPRLAVSERLLRDTGAAIGPIFGVTTDRDAYAMIMTRDAQRIHRLLGEMTEAAARIGPSCIVGDACEGYNPVHDLCRVLINATCTLLGIADPERNLAFRLTGAPTPRPNCTVLRLDAAALARKLAAAASYTAVDSEVRSALSEAGGVDAFGLEVLEPQKATAHPTFARAPDYETFGLERVRLGIYREALTYNHFRAVVDDIDDYVATHV